MSSPVVALEAGRSVVSADVEDALDRRCGATLQFENPDFLPVSYAFEAIPCSGRRVASFVVPTGAPSGDAHITCAPGSSSARTTTSTEGSASESDGAPPTGATLSGSGSLASATSSTGLQASPTASHTSTRTGQASAGASTTSAGAPLDGQTTPGAQASVPAAADESSSLFQVSMASKVVPSPGLTVVATVVSALVSTMTVVQTVTASCSAKA
ncbi:hypothetical protein VDGE_21565 [Verticillium dahliae]|uniref:Uncharacterized protein n=1 Tax=Verticillium dahliae TaxID=27337 RepID=A0A444S501_VERDA|nr:hypothetical protein VDGE_21565 [Verticillium dahliae]